MTNFRITEAPISDRAPNNSSGEASNRRSSRASVGPRLRLFSTFQSASRPSLTQEDVNNRLKLSEILASGVPLVMDPGEFNSDSVFLKRLSHYEFVVRKAGLRNVRILFCKDLDEGIYTRQQLGHPIEDEILMRPRLRVIPIGDLEASPKAHQIDEDIYMPENPSQSRRLFVFIVEGEDSALLVKARAVVMNDADKERMAYIGQHMTERDEKMLTQVEKLKKNSIMRVFKTEELIELMEKTKNVPKPPTKYLLGAKDTLLAYKIFAPANREAVMANLILLSIDSTLLDNLAGTLSTTHPISVILLDLRGFGYSGGRRGHTPSRNQVFKDIGQVVRHVRGFSSKPIILGGYTFGAGMLVNFDRYKHREAVDGYLMISPMFGRAWMSCWREELRTMYQKDKIITTHPAQLYVAQLTKGKVGGCKYVFKMKFDEEMLEFSPMHVSKLTANYVMAYQVDKNGKAFRKLKAPLCVFVAANDEFLVPEQIQAVVEPALPNEESCFFKMKDKTGLGMLLSMTDEVATWIMGLNVVKPWSAVVPTRPQISSANMASLQSVVDMSIIESITEGLNNHVYDHAPKLIDCPKLCAVNYDAWEPTYLPGRPLAVLLYLASRIHAASMPKLAEQHRILVFRIDPWKLVNGHLDVSEKRVWQFFETSIKLIKANFPGTPFFIGGVGIGATLVTGYAKRKDKHPVNGYVLIAPIGDPKSPQNRPFVKKTDAALAAMHYGVLQNQSLTTEQRIILAKAGYLPDLMDELREKLHLSTDMVADIQALDAPASVLLPRYSDCFDYEKLEPELSRFLRPPFKSVQLFLGDSFHVVADSTRLLGEWMMQLSTSMAPRFPLVLRNPTMRDFELIEMIGKGTFGKVFLVRHIQSSRFLAIKVLEKETVVESKQSSQVMREKQVLAECSNCPFIVSFVGSFQDQLRLYLVMEFVIGGELFTRLNAVKRFSVSEARFYLAEVMMAMAYLHDREIVYRDLKPENIVLDALGHVRLVDFGFARHLENGRCRSFCGSPFYIAPEMLSNSKYGKSVDIWALGVLLFELLTGSPPFSGNTANEVYRKILFSNVHVPSFLDSDSRDLLQSLLDPSPDSRLGSRNGLLDVMGHRWFRGVDWERVRSKQLSPPFQPNFSFEGDTTNFVTLGAGNVDFDDDATAPDKYGALFAGF